MKHIWAPWRKKYVGARKKPKGCLFCRIERGPSRRDAGNLLLRRSRHSFLMLNLYPYTNGHLMLVPRRHLPTLEGLKKDERLDLLDLLDRALAALRKAFHPQGFNIGLNVGKAGGAGIPDHAHIHIVPRWLGDTNFMPLLAEVKVIPDTLSNTHRTLTRFLKG